MRIKSLSMENWKGLSGTKTYEIPHVAVLLGKNGAGKTSLIDALKFSLTGEEPEGDPINKGAETASVTVELVKDDGSTISFTREKNREKPSRFFINGKATTQKALNDKLLDVTGLTTEEIKMCSSATHLSSLKPQELSDFILKYIPEKVTLKDIISMIPKSNPEILGILEANLPAEDISIEDIDEFYDFCKEQRKSSKANLLAVKAALEEKPKNAPVESAEAIEKALSELSKREAEAKVYENQMKAYNTALFNKEKYEKMVANTKASLAGLASVTKPVPGAKDKCKNELEAAHETLSNVKVAISGAERSKAELERTLSNLEKPICPLSPNLVCHTDKTEVKTDLLKAVEADNATIVSMTAEKGKAEKKVEELQNEIKKISEQELSYQKKLQLMDQLDRLGKAAPVLPEKPEGKEPVDVSKERFILNRKMQLWNDYQEGRRLLKNMETLTKDVEDYDTLVKLTAPKGQIRIGVIDSYINIFNDLISDRLKGLTGTEYKFYAEDGVKLGVVRGGHMLSVEELSGGETAKVIFALLDVINCLSGGKILFLDELSVLDKDSMSELFNIISAHKDEYDHIFVCSVDTEDAENIVKDNKLTNFSI